jgi:predicted RNA-binding protein with PIN domain
MGGSVAGMPETFIIDAYNVLRRAMPEGQGASSGEASRAILEARLRAFRRTCEPGTRLFVVYDGEGGIPAPARREKGFEVFFSRPPRTADDVVLDLARRHEGEAGVTVVTSDLTDIASRLRGLRVRHWTAEEFAQHLERRLARRLGGGEKPIEAGGDAGKPSVSTAAEVNSWLGYFGFSGAGPDAAPSERKEPK